MKTFRERDLREEMEFHREALRAEGAGAAAFGNELLWRERARDIWGRRWAETLGRNVRQAARQLRRAPGFAAVALLTLTIAIGAATAVFSVAEAALLRPLPVPHAEQLTLLYWASPHAPQDLDTYGTNDGLPRTDGTMTGHEQGSNENYSIGYGEYAAMQGAAARLGSALIGFAPARDPSAIVVNGAASTAAAALVTANYFTGLGVGTERGRTLLPSDFAPGAPLAAVISDGFWTGEYGRSAAAVGSTIRVDGHAAVIVGVAARGFAGLCLGRPHELWLPLAAGNGLLPWGNEPAHGSPFTAGPYWWLQVMARRRAGVSPAQLLAGLGPAFQAAAAGDVGSILRPGEQTPRLRVIAGAQGINYLEDRYGATIEVLLAGVGLLLLLACVNLASLLLARSSARRREIAVRLALGAGRGQLVGQLLTESVFLGLLGGAAGLGLASPASRLLAAWLANQGSAPFVPVLDWRVAAFGLGVATVCGMVFGLAPALRCTRMELAGAVKREAAAGPQPLRTDKGLAVAQVALSLLLLAGAGLLLRTWTYLLRQPLGFDPAGVVTFALQGRAAGHRAADLPAFYLEAQRRLAAVPGVLGVSASQHSILGGDLGGDGVRIPSSDNAAKEHDLLRNGVGPAFFSTLRIPILRGRAIDESDVREARPVCVINQKAARTLFPHGDAIGQTILRIDSSSATTAFTVVGIAGDARYADLTDPLSATYYIPYTRLSALYDVTFEVRTAAAPAAVLPEIRTAIRRLDPNLPLVGVETQATRDLTTLASQRLLARLGSFFALVGLLLAAMGLYGVLAYAVARRTREIGIRMALGAERGRVLAGVLRESVQLGLLGVGIGVALALASASLIAAQLSGVAARDPETLAAAAGLLLAVALLAGWLPARRAASTDPAITLRCE